MEFSAPPDIARLNEQQKKAVLHEGGPLLVFAGAGSGKTRVITSRIARLLSEGVPPYRVLAVTFTNKAAREMKERLESHFQRKPDGLWVGTFHSICGRILRVEGHHIGVPNDYVIYDDSDQITLVKSILKLKGYSDKEVP
ncbi:MAG: UvrD-helicase domain-containing protein, partial [Fimbriimonadaceae bacterium]